MINHIPTPTPIKISIGNRTFVFRSKAEVLYALYLQNCLKRGQIMSWQYEFEVFNFDVPKANKVRSYIPDFKVIVKRGDNPIYIEVKGKMTRKDYIKHRLFRAAGYGLKVVFTSSGILNGLYSDRAYNEYIYRNGTTPSKADFTYPTKTVFVKRTKKSAK